MTVSTDALRVLCARCRNFSADLAHSKSQFKRHKALGECREKEVDVLEEALSEELDVEKSKVIERELTHLRIQLLAFPKKKKRTER